MQALVRMGVCDPAHSQRTVNEGGTKTKGGRETARLRSEGTGPMRALSNNGLHQTGRGGVAFASRRRPVVEARPAGEAKC